MNTPRTMPNLIEEAAYLTDDSTAYGALILARAIGHAIRDDNPTPAPTLALQLFVTKRRYGFLTDALFPDHPARRHVTLTDAAELAFACTADREPAPGGATSAWDHHR